MEAKEFNAEVRRIAARLLEAAPAAEEAAPAAEEAPPAVLRGALFAPAVSGMAAKVMSAAQKSGRR